MVREEPSSTMVISISLGWSESSLDFTLFPFFLISENYTVCKDEVAK
jgi:hypothetical protein